MSKVSWPGGSPDRTARPASWNIGGKDNVPRPIFPAAKVEPLDPVSPPPPARPVDRQDEPPVPPQPQPPQPPPPAAPSPLEQELKLRAELFARAIDELGEGLERERRTMAEEVVELGLAVAEELASGALAIEPARVLALVQESLDLLAEERDLKVRLHPSLMEELERNGLLENLKENPRVKVRSDVSVGDSGCIVESRSGRVDARVRARLSKLRYLLAQGEGYEEDES